MSKRSRTSKAPLIKSRVNNRRAAGIFCAISSLPSETGIGNFGTSAYEFVDWLAKAGQMYWQILPLTIPDKVGSPYSPASSIAGNWTLLSLQKLIDDGLFPPHKLPKGSRDNAPVQHRRVAKEKLRDLKVSFAWFREHGTLKQQKSFKAWRRAERDWLEDYSLYAALKDAFGRKDWWQWPKSFRSPLQARKQVPAQIQKRQEFHAYVQWLFAKQWGALKAYANKRGIKIIGDLPFYPPIESADVWSRPELFKLNAKRRMTYVAGVPPDVFNDVGQRWGNPVYRWSAHRRDKFQWWRDRIGTALRNYDILRIDHFRGYANTWQIPFRAKDARSGHWEPTPGKQIIRRIQRRWPRLPFIAEDLGLFSPNAESLRRASRIDGMRVLLFAWSGLKNNIHHPHLVVNDFFYYTSTHDTNTVLGWWRDDAEWYEKKHVREYFSDISEVNWKFIEEVYRSRADVAIVPIQDVLGLGSASRINRPGKIRGNWSWRLSSKQLTAPIARKLNTLTKSYA